MDEQLPNTYAPLYEEEAVIRKHNEELVEELGFHAAIMSPRWWLGCAHPKIDGPCTGKNQICPDCGFWVAH